MVSKYANLPAQTFYILQSDSLQRGLVGDIMSRFEKRGYNHSPIYPVHVVPNIIIAISLLLSNL